MLVLGLLVLLAVLFGGAAVVKAIKSANPNADVNVIGAVVAGGILLVLVVGCSVLTTK